MFNNQSTTTKVGATLQEAYKGFQTSAPQQEGTMAKPVFVGFPGIIPHPEIPNPETSSNTSHPNVGIKNEGSTSSEQDPHPESNGKKMKSKPRKPRNNTHRTVRTIVKEIDGTYKAKTLTSDLPLKRQQRATKAAKERGISTRNIYAWSKSTSSDNLIRYINATQWNTNLIGSFQGKRGKDTSISQMELQFSQSHHPNLKDRKQKAHDLAHIHYHRMMTLAQTNAANILQTPTKYRGTYTPKTPSTIILLDMTVDSKVKDVLSLYLHDVVEVDGDSYATLFVPVPKSGSYISVTVMITKFNSYLDSPKTAWKSLKGTRKSTMRLFRDREGIHTAALQDLDMKVERSDHGFKAKMVVVHDAQIDMSSLKDVVHTDLDNVIDVVASRVRDMGLQYVE